jgi:hypothetical protein
MTAAARVRIQTEDFDLSAEVRIGISNGLGLPRCLVASWAS